MTPGRRGPRAARAGRRGARTARRAARAGAGALRAAEGTMALTLAAAHACIARGIARARELGFAVAVAVVDAGGHLVACDRMDGALWVTPEIARAKANAAAAFQATTLDLEERFTRRALFASTVATLGACRFVFGKGGVPIVADGRVVGAVGVSGAVPAENDHTIADAAAGHPAVVPGH